MIEIGKNLADVIEALIAMIGLGFFLYLLTRD